MKVDLLEASWTAVQFKGELGKIIQESQNHSYLPEANCICQEEGLPQHPCHAPSSVRSHAQEGWLLGKNNGRFQGIAVEGKSQRCTLAGQPPRGRQSCDSAVLANALQNQIPGLQHLLNSEVSMLSPEVFSSYQSFHNWLAKCRSIKESACKSQDQPAHCWLSSLSPQTRAKLKFERPQTILKMKSCALFIF